MSSNVLFEYRQPGLAGLLLRRIRCFELRGDQVASWYEGPRGVSNRRAKALKDIPAKRHFREVQEPDFLLQGITVLSSIVVLVVLLIVHGNEEATWIVFVAGGVALAAMIPASALLSYPATYIPLGENTLIIHRSKWHDAILNEIASRKQAHFAPMAVIDPDRSVRENIKNLRRLADIDAIPAETYWGVCGQLAPALMPPVRAQQATLRMQQRRCLTGTKFDMRSDHIRYESWIFGRGGSCFPVEYTALPERSAIKEKQDSSPALLTASIISGLSLALAADFIWIAPFSSFIESAIFMGWALMPVGIALRILVFPIQELRQGFFVLQEADIRGDEIITELEKRRIAALRALAAPDPILTVAEQVARLKRYKESGIISETEFVRFAAEVTASDLPDLDLLPEAELKRPSVLH